MPVSKKRKKKRTKSYGPPPSKSSLAAKKNKWDKRKIAIIVVSTLIIISLAASFIVGGGGVDHTGVATDGQDAGSGVVGGQDILIETPAPHDQNTMPEDSSSSDTEVEAPAAGE